MDFEPEKFFSEEYEELYINYLGNEIAESSVFEMNDNRIADYIFSENMKLLKIDDRKLLRKIYLITTFLS